MAIRLVLLRALPRMSFCARVCAFPWGMYPGVQPLSSMFSPSRCYQSFPRWFYPSTSPAVCESWLLHIITKTWPFLSFNSSPSREYVVCGFMVVLCISLVSNEAERLFLPAFLFNLFLKFPPLVTLSLFKKKKKRKKKK